MSRNLLSISWLNGRLRAAVCRQNVTTASWSSPTQIEDLDQLKSALVLAREQLKFTGVDVVFVVENKHLVYHLMEAPTARRSTLRSFVDRRIAQSRFYEEDEALWGSSPMIKAKAGQRLMLSILPRSFVIGLRTLCTELGYRLKGVFAPGFVLGRQFLQLAVEEQKSALLAVDVSGTLCLLSARRDGQLLFARNVSLQSASPVPVEGAVGAASGESTGGPMRIVRTVVTRDGQDRLEQEINRTRLFCQQQFENGITQLWVLGENGERIFKDIKLPDGVTMQVAPVEVDEFFFCREAAKLPIHESANLMQQIVGEQFIRQRNATLSFAAVLVASLLCAAGVNHVARSRELERQTVEAELVEAREQEENVLKLIARVKEEVALVNAVGSPDDAPFQNMFLRYLGRSLPDPFVLTRLELNRGTNAWTFRLEGRQRETAEGQLATVEMLEQELTSGPFKARILSSTRTRIFQEANQEQRRVPLIAPGLDSEKPFFVEGSIP